jgi:hypothetical protein
LAIAVGIQCCENSRLFREPPSTGNERRIQAIELGDGEGAGAVLVVAAEKLDGLLDQTTPVLVDFDIIMPVLALSPPDKKLRSG